MAVKSVTSTTKPVCVLFWSALPQLESLKPTTHAEDKLTFCILRPTSAVAMA